MKPSIDRYVILTTLATASALCGVAAQAVPAGSAQKGKKIFMSYGCYQCHGREGQGGAGTGPRLGPRPVAFMAFSKYIRQPTGQMPPYTSKVVSDRELADMYAFLQSLPQPSPVKSIPLLEDLK